LCWGLGGDDRIRIRIRKKMHNLGLLCLVVENLFFIADHSLFFPHKQLYTSFLSSLFIGSLVSNFPLPTPHVLHPSRPCHEKSSTFLAVGTKNSSMHMKEESGFLEWAFLGSTSSCCTL